MSLYYVILNSLTEDLEASFVRLLDATADHYVAARDIIAAMAPHHSEQALEFAKMLNTEYRRDSVLVDLVEAMVSRPVNDISVKALRDLFGQFRYSTNRDAA